MPFVDSPGWDRDWFEHPWTWDFEVSTVSEGHRVVKDQDKSEAKEQGAKLTFGEVLDCGVSRMLYNLGAPHKQKFHDLGMGPGKMLIQSYLQFYNLNCCMGVELAKGRYQLAENNVRTLMRVGWRGRKFMGIEFKKDAFMKIVELTPNQTPANGWKVGDAVVAFHPLIRLKKETIPDYSGVISEIVDKEKGLYSVKYNDTSINPNISKRPIQLKYLFVPESVRTLEIWYGSLFDYPDGFNAQICVLETDFPDEMHPELIRRMANETPIGCSFLTYHNLKKFECFDWDNLRQIDNNVYDNDRYITSWSQGWRFYTWEHCRNQKTSKPYDKPIAKGEFNGSGFSVGDSVIFHGKDEKDGKTFGVVTKIEFSDGLTVDKEKQVESKDDEKENDLSGREIKYLTIKTLRPKEDNKSMKEGTVIISSDEINNGDKLLYRTSYLHRVGEQICAHHKDLLKSNDNNRKFDTLYGSVIGCDSESLTYCIRYENMRGEATGQFDMVMAETLVFKPPKLLFKIGEQVMACWTRNAQNKNCIHRYKRFPGKIIGINNDATYRVQFDTTPYLLSLLRPELYPLDYNEKTKQNLNDAAPTAENAVATCVREMWIQSPAKFVVKEFTQLEEKIGVPLYNDVDYGKCEEWNNGQVLNYVKSLGLFGININDNNDEKENNSDLKSIITKCEMNGKQLFGLAQKIDSINEERSKENDNNDKDKNENDKKFNRKDLVEYFQQVYDENHGKASSKDNDNDKDKEKENSESDSKSDEIIKEFGNFSISKVDFLNLSSNLLYIKSLFEDEEEELDSLSHGHVHGPNCNHDHMQHNMGNMDMNFLSTLAKQYAASSANANPNDPAQFQNMLIKNMQQLRNQYPAAFQQIQTAHDEQDTDRKED